MFEENFPLLKQSILNNHIFSMNLKFPSIFLAPSHQVLFCHKCWTSLVSPYLLPLPYGQITLLDTKFVSSGYNGVKRKKKQVFVRFK